MTTTPRDLCQGDIARVTPVRPLMVNCHTADDWSIVAVTLNEDNQLALGLFGPGTDETLTTRNDITSRTWGRLYECFCDIRDHSNDVWGNALATYQKPWGVIDFEAETLHTELMAEREKRRTRLSTFAGLGDDKLMHTEILIDGRGSGIRHTRVYKFGATRVDKLRDDEEGVEHAGRAIRECLAYPNRCTPFVAHHPLSRYGVYGDRNDLLSVRGSGQLAF
ncbi:hypothetical protein J7355_15635 [Endozoicomonas sp. G2_2]|uniref:hypothetical protein n=1 Tax=Endozoicomonas sp. G2_2 TaxID=2821092 RepID=UPI001ADABCB2|nr:hypothetical protein [Endozoicomonas sp. G2_2]MBO9471521.1 hypothetical protein [Endozoicomonas sp. G2_2]